MSFIDNNNGLAVGTTGGLVRTTDGGRNWQSIPYKYVTNTGSVALPTFNDVHFITPSVAYAVASGGLMIKSTDGGINWAPVTTPLTARGKNINGLYFLNKDTGYIGGQAINTTNTTSINDAPKVYFTRDGGANWDSLATPFVPQAANATLNWNNGKQIFRIDFANDSVGYVCGGTGSEFTSSLLWKIEKGIITDYSLHRSKFGMASGSYQPATQTYKGLIAVNDSLVLMSCTPNSMVMRVKTGKNDSTANAVPAIYGAYVKGTYELVVSLSSFTPFRPASLVNDLVAGDMLHLKKGPDGKIFLTAGNSLCYTTDNGTTWSSTKPHPATVRWGHWKFTAMDVTPNGRIIIGGINGVTYDSLPGASSWQTTYRNARPFFNTLASMDWADPCNGIAVGSNGGIIKTTDGGKTWVSNTNTVLEADFQGLANVFYHSVNNMVFNTALTVYRSADQGTTTDAIFTDPHPKNLNGFGINQFTMVGPDIAFVAGYRNSPEVQRSVIFRSLNASAATPVWDSVKAFPPATFAPQFKNIKFANRDTGYVTGNRGKVYRTADGGATWTDVSPDTTVNGSATYTALSVVDGKTVFIGGNGRRLFKSTDGGATWINMTIVLPASPALSVSNIDNIVMNDANNGYLNSGSTLLKTADAWATWTYDLAPIGFSNIFLYPKMAAPLANKKLYGLKAPFAGFPLPDFVSPHSSAMMEYGEATVLANVASTETTVNATCTNPTAGSITVTATGGIPPYTYSIDGGAFQTSNAFTGLTQGAKSIIIKDAGCQSLTKTVTVGFTDNLVLTTNNDTTVCAGAPVPMLATTNGTGTTYAWSPSAGLSAANISNPTVTVNATSAFTVAATLNGCVKTETVNIAINPNPVVNAGADKTILIGESVALNGSSVSTPQTIVWSPEATIISGTNTFTPVVKPQVTTTYVMTVKDMKNCTSKDSAQVTIIPYCVQVKEAFTPNGDGMNDQWLVTSGNGCTTKISVSVFNRYGSLIYKNDNYNNDWNGTYEGKPVADGTYYYIVHYKLISGKSVQQQGNLTILR